MSNPLIFDVTNGFSRWIAIEYDGYLIDSDSIGHEGVIKCKIVTIVVRMCLRKYNTVICGICACCVSNAAEPFVTVQYVEIYRNASYLLALFPFF